MYIDTHAHIYANEFIADSSLMIERALENNVMQILMPAIDSKTHYQMLALEKQHTGQCLSMMGVHPCSVNEGFEDELTIAYNFLQQKKFIAIGETGLDFYWDATYKTQQYIAFERQIAWALEYSLPIVIHSRNSLNECIDVVRPYAGKGLNGVFHCFGGNSEQARQIAALGFYLGIGGVVTFKKSGLDEIVKQIPLDAIILETDAPYLAPTPHRGKRNEPAYIPLIAQKIADCKQVSIISVAETTTSNAKKLFKL